MLKSLVSANCSYTNAKGKWITNAHPKLGIPQVGEVIKHTVRKTFFDIWYYYANLIDYMRLVMALTSLLLIALIEKEVLDQQGLITWSLALLILASKFLFLLNGSLTKNDEQTSIMEVGWNWSVEVLTHYGLSLWCMKIDDVDTTSRLLVVLFTSVKVVLALFDFAMKAQGVYPMSETNNLPCYFRIRQLITPCSFLDYSCWIFESMYCVCVCLKLSYSFQMSLLTFSIIYFWYEGVNVLFTLANWRETSVALHQQGIEVIRECNESEIDLLKQVYDETKQELAILNKEENKKEVSWVNLYQNETHAPLFDNYHLKSTFKQFVDNLLVEIFGKKHNQKILTYGFITAPKRGTIYQGWHFDYGDDVNGIFIPIHEMTHLNATQFIRGPLGIDMPKSEHFPAPKFVREQEKKKCLEVCQVICKPFMIFRMHPKISHRGIANGEDYDRGMFFIHCGPTSIKIADSHYVNKDLESIKT